MQYCCIFSILTLVLLVSPSRFAIFLKIIHMSPIFKLSLCGGEEWLLNALRISSVSIFLRMPFWSSTSDNESDDYRV